MTPAKKAYSYIRFSSEKQAMGDSLRRQIELTRAYCLRKGLDLDESFQLQDLGVSAFKGGNLAAKNGKKASLARFLELCENGTIERGSALVVETLDRLTRQDPWEAVALFSRIRKLGIEIHMTMRDKVISPEDKNDDSLMEVVFSARGAHEESAKKSERLCQVFKQKRQLAAEKKAIFSKTVPWWLAIQKDKIVAVPARAKVVRQIFQWKAEGWSSQKIARKLNADKVPTWRPRAKEWSDSRIRDLIRYDQALGALVPTQKTKAIGGPPAAYRIDGYYPRIVSDALAIKARSSMVSNLVGVRKADAERKPVNLFTGILRYKGRWCRHQSRRNGMPGADGKKEWCSYYDDHNPNQAGKRTWSIAGTQLEKVVLAGLVELKPEDLLPQVHKKGKKRSVILQDEVGKLDRQVTYVVDALARSKGSKALLTRLEKLEAELDAKQKELAEAEKQETRSNQQALASSLASIKPDISDLRVRAKTAVILQGLIERIDVAESLDDLPLIRDMAKNLNSHQGYLKMDAVKDPVPLKSKRRRPLALLIKFRSGGKRIIVRTKSPHLMSGRYCEFPTD